MTELSEFQAEFAEALKSGLVTNNSPHVRRFEAELQRYYGCPIMPSVNCNGELALYHLIQAWKHKLGYGPHDTFEVLVPSFTFSGTINAIVTNNLKPVFCDVDPQTFLLTPETVRAALAPIAAATLMVVGLADDIFALRGRQKLLLQILIERLLDIGAHVERGGRLRDRGPLRARQAGAPDHGRRRARQIDAEGGHEGVTAVVVEGAQGVDPGVVGDRSQLVEAGGLGLRPGFRTELVEGVAVPVRQRLLEHGLHPGERAAAQHVPVERPPVKAVDAQRGRDVEPTVAVHHHPDIRPDGRADRRVQTRVLAGILRGPHPVCAE